ncbi:MAG: hypothetical protein K2X93_13490 [Candidatus Obscuribacterales bacterium]|nr:hypothetical protein [Candidatus Obscuribacterales bacterium]
MKRATKSLSVFLAFGVVLSSANAAFAEEFLNGANIQMGSNGPTGSFNTAASSGNTGGTFGFSLPADNNTAAFNTAGGAQSRGSGVTGGSYANSQGDTGKQSGRDSKTTNTKFQGNSRVTHPRQNQGLFETTRNNILSTNSFDQTGVPSGRFTYGFQGGAGAYAGTASTLFTRGWFLQPTSTGSVDINTVDP